MPPPSPDAPLDGIGSSQETGGSADLPIGIIAGVAAGGVVLSVITGVVAYKKAKRSKQARAALAAPVPVEMMPTSTRTADGMKPSEISDQAVEKDTEEKI